ncbi:MAG: hypothetical protein ACK42C_01115 [Aquificaceae bacterium]
MKWYEWLAVVSLIFFSNVFTAFLVKEYFFKVKTVDLLALGLYDMQNLSQRLASGEDPQKVQEEIKLKSKLLEQYLKSQRGLILIKQCVLSGSQEDITNEVVNYLKSH